MSENKRLIRSMSDKMIGGVCAGLAKYFGIDVTLVRVIYAGVVLLGAGSPILLYLLLWIIMPAEGTPRAMAGTGEVEVEEEPPVV